MPKRLQPGPEASAATSSAHEKLDYACPGCNRSLRVRREFFGSTIVCKHCGHQFVPQAAPDPADPPPAAADQAPAPAPPPAHGVETAAWPTLAAPPAVVAGDNHDALIRALGGQVQATQARLDALDQAAAGRDEALQSAIGDLGRFASDLMSVRLALAALGDDLSAARGDESPADLIEAARQTVLAEVASLVQEERQAQQDRWQPLQATLDQLHQHHQEFADQHAAALAQASALGDRLGVLESSPRVDPAQAARLDRLDAAWADLTADAAALRAQADRLHEQVRNLPTSAPESAGEAPHLAEIHAAFATLQAEQEAFRVGLTEHETRRAELAATVQRLEAAWVDESAAVTRRWQDFADTTVQRHGTFEAEAQGRWHEAETAAADRRAAFEAEMAERRAAFETEMADRHRAFEVEVAERQQAFEALHQTRWNDHEARTTQRWAEVDRLHEQLQQVDEIQMARLDDLAAATGRVDTLAADAASFRRVCDSLRDQHDAANRALTHRLQTFEAELGRLRDSKPTRTLGPQPAVTAGPVIRPAAPGRSSGDPAVPFDSWPDLDTLIEDLVHERSGKASTSTATATASPGAPATPAPTQVRSQPPLPTDSAALAEVYASRRNEYYQAVNAGQFAAALPAARFLVDLTQRCTDVPNLDHALWLRNLGIALSMAGQPGEARSRLDAALAICESDAEPAQVPRLMCLFDLVEFCLNRGERWQALDSCERALNLMNGIANIPEVVQQRAEACLDRIQDQEGVAAGGPAPRLDPTANIVATA